MLKKLFLSLCLATTAFLAVLPSPALAQRWWNPTFQEFTTKVEQGDVNDIFGERYTFAQVTWIIYSLAGIIGGDAVTKCSTRNNIVEFVQCIQNPPTTFLSSPVLAFAGFSDSLLQTRAASGVEWVKNTAANFHIIPEANAQGTGFKALAISQQLWRASRDFSYALLTLTIVILAFMIMFRVKISAQMAITVQTAIPRVAIALILITFSYAIAGFIIDIAYIAQGVFAMMITAGGISAKTNPLEIFNAMNNGFSGVMSLGIAYLFIAMFPAVILGGIAAMIPSISPAGLPLIGVSVVIAMLIILLFLYATLRIFWLMLKTYVTVLLLVIIAPYFILLGTVTPTIGFSGWIKSVISNVAVFPVISVLILFAHIMFWSTISLGTVNTGFGSDPNSFPVINPFAINPNLTGGIGSGASMPTFGANIPTSFVGFAASIMVMLGIPGIANTVKNGLLSGRFALSGKETAGSGIGLLTAPVAYGVANTQKVAGESAASLARAAILGLTGIRNRGGQARVPRENVPPRPEA